MRISEPKSVRGYALASAPGRRTPLSEPANRAGTYSRARDRARVLLPIQDGCVMVVSDQHYEAGKPSPAHKASLILAKKLKPYAIVANGDAIDGASISRWPVSSFTEYKNRPTVAAELSEAITRFKEYEELRFVQFRTWNLGNHDARFETRLAEKVPEYAGVDGFTLKERFPGWLPAWRTDFCATPTKAPAVIVKHRFKGGMYSAHNNSLWAGTSIVTGHDHALYAKSITDVHGLRWGIDAGTISTIDSSNFTNYTEDNVQNWQSGFVFLHFRGGYFTGPELVHVTQDGYALFRGEALKV